MLNNTKKSGGNDRKKKTRIHLKKANQTHVKSNDQKTWTSSRNSLTLIKLEDFQATRFSLSFTYHIVGVKEQERNFQITTRVVWFRWPLFFFSPTLKWSGSQANRPSGSCELSWTRSKIWKWIYTKRENRVNPADGRRVDFMQIEPWTMDTNMNDILCLPILGQIRT